MARHIRVTNDRLGRVGAKRWSRPKGQQPMLQPAETGGSVYPAYVVPDSYSVTESWDYDSGKWTWKDYNVDPVSPGALTDWQFSDGGKKISASVELPEWAPKAGLPAALFVSFAMIHPSSDNGIDAKGKWSMVIDVSEALDNTVIRPLKSFVGPNGVAFAAYLFGFVKPNIKIPAVELTVDAFWTTSGYTTYSGALYSNVTTSLPVVSDASAAPLKKAPECCLCGKDTWIMVTNDQL